MYQPVAIITEEFQDMIEAIRRPHIKVAWSILNLHVGHESAIKRNDLVRQVRVAIGRPKYSERAVRKLCEVIRNAGIPICSDRNGYWVGTPTETLEWSAWYMAHAFTMLRIAYRLVKGAKKMTDDPDVREQADKMEQEIQLTLDLQIDKQ